MRKLDTLLVTGGAGFIGSAFIRSLFGASTFAGKIINLDALTYAGNLENLEGHVDVERYVFVKGDIRDQGLVEKLLQAHAVDAVVHFAAESHVDRSIHGPREFLETNIMGTFALLEALRAHKAGGGGVCTGATGAGAVDPASHRHSTGRNRCRASGQGLEQFCQGLGLAVARRHHGLGRGHRPGNAYRWVVEAEAGFAGRVVK